MNHQALSMEAGVTLADNAVMAAQRAPLEASRHLRHHLDCHSKTMRWIFMVKAQSFPLAACKLAGLARQSIQGEFLC
jgi:hypothetical protein